MRPFAKPLILLILCAAIAAFFYWFFHSGTAQPTPGQPGSGDAASISESGSTTPASTAKSDPPQSSPTAPAAPGAVPPFANTAPLPPVTPFRIGSPDTPPPMDPDIVLSNMRIVIKRYGSRYGGNPVGNNLEITAALNGGNTNQAKFIDVESGLRINGQGELVDYWGTPFFFHQLAGNEMEIRSAGPDKHMWTPDDLVTK